MMNDLFNNSYLNVHTSLSLRHVSHTLVTATSAILAASSPSLSFNLKMQLSGGMGMETLLLADAIHGVCSGVLATLCLISKRVALRITTIGSKCISFVL